MRDESYRICGEVNKNLRREYKQLSNFETCTNRLEVFTAILRAIFRTAQNDAVRVVWKIPK